MSRNTPIPNKHLDKFWPSVEKKVPAWESRLDQPNVEPFGTENINMLAILLFVTKIKECYSVPYGLHKCNGPARIVKVHIQLEFSGYFFSETFQYRSQVQDE